MHTRKHVHVRKCLIHLEQWEWKLWLVSSVLHSQAGVTCSTLWKHLQPEGLEKCIKLNLLKHVTKGDQWNCCGLWLGPLSCVWADPFLKLKRGNYCHSWLTCCFSLLFKTGPVLNRWNEVAWSLWPEGAWDLSDHIVLIGSQEQAFIHRKKKKGDCIILTYFVLFQVTLP